MDGHLWHGNYAPSLSLESYMSLVSHRFPALAQILWFDRAGADEALARLYRVSNEFETNAEGGRGDSYRLAQRHREVRSQGICSLFALAAGVREIYGSSNLTGMRLRRGYLGLDLAAAERERMDGRGLGRVAGTVMPAAFTILGLTKDFKIIRKPRASCSRIRRRCCSAWKGSG